MRDAIRSVDSTHAIFNIDSAWTDSDGHTDPRPWWLKWCACTHAGLARSRLGWLCWTGFLHESIDCARPVFMRRNTDADVSCHDNYPFPGLTMDHEAYGLSMATLSHSQGIPETVRCVSAASVVCALWSSLAQNLKHCQLSAPLWHCSLAVSANAEKKPVWLCIQSFEGTAGPRFYWTMPTERQLRAQAFAGIIHGAT